MCALINLEDNYSMLLKHSKNIIEDVDLQMCYPDEKTEEELYRESTRDDSGLKDVSILSPDLLNE